MDAGWTHVFLRENELVERFDVALREDLVRPQAVQVAPVPSSATPEL